jgi:hypothetical protein
VGVSIGDSVAALHGVIVAMVALRPPATRPADAR